MDKTHTAFTGSVPENYDKYLAHPLLEMYADDLVDRFVKFNPKNILEIACGTGIVTQRILDALPDAKVTATDLNSDMIEYGKRKLNTDNNLKWITADALELPFENESFDSAICQFGIMFFPDKLKSLREVYRLLKPGGVYMFDTWDSFENNPGMQTVDEVVKNTFMEDPPDFYKIPFSFHEKEEIQKLTREAGFKSASIEYVSHEMEAESSDFVVTGIIEGNPILHQILDRDPAMVPELKKNLKKVIIERFGDNPVRSISQAIICVCRK